MKVLVLNSGSSSVKYALFDSQNLIKSALIERVENHDKAIADILSDIGTIDAVGHRVVHGGETYTGPIRIDSAVIQTIEDLIPLAPLHNKANLAGIKAVLRLFPDIPQIAVFDTSFHQSIPDYAYRYALPETLYTLNKIRRYGFHGTSHNFLLKAAAEYLKRPLQELNLITFHLGNGDSVCAIQNGKSIDISMGFTPLEGLIMGTRSGDIDPEIVIYLQQHTQMRPDEIDTLLNKESGLKGLCGMSDMRDVAKAARHGDEKAQLAINMFTYHAKKYLGSYFAILGRVDGIIFSGGIGEHSAMIREKILHGLNHMGIEIDTLKNDRESTETFEISAPYSKIRVLVTHTDEELEIASETIRILKQN
jgi:acetate kinase